MDVDDKSTNKDLSVRELLVAQHFRGGDFGRISGGVQRCEKTHCYREARDPNGVYPLRLEGDEAHRVDRFF